MTSRALVGVAFCLAAGLGFHQGGDRTEHIRVGGRDRTYLLHVPPNASGARPLVVLLHGRLGDGAGEARLSYFDPIADSVGAIAAYPDGYRRSWADGRLGTPADRAGIDDVAFFRALVADVAAHAPVDSSRIYVAGMSNGGFMTERLICDASDLIAAAGIVAATLGDSLAGNCHAARSVPVMTMNGTDDPLVPYQGGTLGGGRGTVLGAIPSLDEWVHRNGCAERFRAIVLPDTARDGTTINERVYPCPSGADVVGITVVHGGHTWPSGPQYLPKRMIGISSRNLDGSRTLWTFFAAHRRTNMKETR